MIYQKKYQRCHSCLYDLPCEIYIRRRDCKKWKQKKYYFDYTCINPRSKEELDYICDNMRPMNRNRFLRLFSIEEINEALAQGSTVQYNSKLEILRDWGVRFFWINDKKISAVIMVNSEIDHIFKEVEI